MRFAVLVMLLLLPGAARAFDSYPPGAPHDQITLRACDGAGIARGTAGALCAAVRRVDRSESRWGPSWSPRTWLRFRANERYQPAHHFDRPPDLSDRRAFIFASAHVRQSLLAAAAAAERRDRDAAIAALGAALHAVQDLYAHSNLVDLPAASVDSVERALWDGAVEPSALLRITGYDPAARDPESPQGDAYCHRDFAKDATKKNAESRVRVASESKFERAMRLAITASRHVLERARAGVSSEAWRALAD